MFLEVTKHTIKVCHVLKGQQHRASAVGVGSTLIPPGWLEGSVGLVVVCVSFYIKVTSLSWFILTWSRCVHSTKSVMHKSAQNEDKVPLSSLTKAIPLQNGSCSGSK